MEVVACRVYFEGAHVILTRLACKKNSECKQIYDNVAGILGVPLEPPRFRQHWQFEPHDHTKLTSAE